MLSLITPTHNPYVGLVRLYQSLCRQTDKRFEWVIVPNRGASVDKVIPSESWIRVVPYTQENTCIGSIKRFAFLQGQGDWLVEVDHDDELIDSCVEKIINVVSSFDCDFVYSDSIDIDKSGNSIIYDKSFGWVHYNFTYDSKNYVINKTPTASPQSISRIWTAPNHVRAWKTDFYRRIGGHDPNLKALDDQELMCRTYLHGKMTQINEPLYFYRVHGNNSYSSQELNGFIQDFTWSLYDAYIIPMAERYCELNGLIKLDLCGGHNSPPGYISIDRKNGSITHDLETTPWPILSNSCGLVRAQDALEHMKDPITTMKEIYRILAPGGILISSTPSTDGRGAFQDPTHKSFWNINSFWYYTRKEQAVYIDIPVRFQAIRLKNYFPSKWHEENNIPYIAAHLVALKGGPEWNYAPGKIEI